jgi:fibronectin-binding autotransporter adhesin
VAAAIPDVSYFAYGTNQYGVNVTCGDVDGDGIDEIVTGPGPGAAFGAHVRGWDYDGSSITPLPGFSFFAWSPDDLRYGAKVFAGADLDSDGRNEVVVGAGPDVAADTTVKVYGYDGVGILEWFSLEAYPGMNQGVSVAAGRF